MNYIFCDTMVYLHYRMFTEIDFSEIIGDAPVTLVVPEIVVKEIDDHKDFNQQKKIRDRASRVHTAFFKYLFLTGNAEIKRGYSIYYLPEKKLDFIKYNLDEQKNDHRLIAAILDFKQSKTDNDDVFLISQDFAASFTAKGRGISVFQLDDKLKLVDEQSEEEKQIKQLKSKLSIYENTVPQLAIRGADTISDIIHITADDLLCFSISEDIPSLEEQRSKFPLKQEIKPIAKSEKDTPWGMAKELDQKLRKSLWGENAIEKENAEIRRYMHDRSKYFEDYAEYLNELDSIKKKIYIKISLCIVNTGYTPAKNVSLYLHFPDGFEMHTEENFPELPAAPEEPVFPRPPQALLAESLLPHSVFSYDTLQLPKPAIWDSFSLKKTNSYEIEDQYQYIQHGKDISYKIRDLFLVYESIECLKNFHAEYIFRGENLPEAQCGTINFVFDL